MHRQDIERDKDEEEEKKVEEKKKATCLTNLINLFTLSTSSISKHKIYYFKCKDIN